MNPATPKSPWLPASLPDTALVHAIMRDFYAEENLRYDEASAASAVGLLLADPQMGAIFLLRNVTGAAHGYFVVTLGFSLEFGGRYALLDELFLQPSARGQGLGQAALAAAEAWAASHNIFTLRIEVNHHNEKARGFYLKSGFRDDQRDLLSKRISSGGK